MKTERLTLEKLASCMAAPIPTIPEHVLQVNRSKSYWVINLHFQLDPVVDSLKSDSISWCNFAKHGH